MVSAVQIDAYDWGSTKLKGVGDKLESGAWLSKVRMEYDFEVQAKRAKALCKPFQRIDQGGKIYLVVKA